MLPGCQRIDRRNHWQRGLPLPHVRQPPSSLTTRLRLSRQSASASFATGFADPFLLSPGSVYAPTSVTSTSKYPVVTWIHGGSFTSGGAADLDPGAFANSQHVIVVVVQYRLGALGFLKYDTLGLDGNYGLKDVILALSASSSPPRFPFSFLSLSLPTFPFAQSGSSPTSLPTAATLPRSPSLVRAPVPRSSSPFSSLRRRLPSSLAPSFSPLLSTPSTRPSPSPTPSDSASFRSLAARR